MAAGLSQTQRVELAKHSRAGTGVAAGRLRRFLSDGRWIGKTNVYADDASERLKRDWKAHRVPKARNLGQYVAASGPLHALDGWAFLSRALEACAKGDPDAARHLGYYAELRGSLSLLASQGIGVFNGKHVVIEAPGDARVFTGDGTHVMAWLALQYWMGTPESAQVIGGLVRQNGEPIDAWLDNLPAGNPWAAIGTSWLTSWGVDLEDAFHDRGARNKSSYAPTRFYNTRVLSAFKTKEFLTDWWRTLEPVVGYPFEVVDRHLLRATLEQAFRATRGVTHQANPELFKSDLSAVKVATTGDGTLDDGLGRFLTRQSQASTSPLLLYAERHDPPEIPEQHLQVISRATLLLRLASGAAGELLHRAGLSAEDVAFWMTAVGEDRALWLPGDEPDPLTELWADVGAALETLAEVEAPEPQSYRALQDRCADALWVATGAERVALWGAAA